MQKFIISKSSEIKGEIAVKGAKNQALKAIPAAILSGQTTVISNLPQIKDIGKSLDLLATLGAKIKLSGDTVEIDASNLDKWELSPELANKFRASIMFVGPLLARFGKARFPHPGGCVIGAGGRPIDLFLEGFKRFGAEISQDQGGYSLKAKTLKPADYFFSKVSVTATEAMMMTATLIPGTSTLKNCAMEPEIKALADYLNSVGAKIKGAGTPTMVIDGVNEIGGGNCEIIPDRIETGSFAILAAAHKSDLKISKCQPQHIEILLDIFKNIGVNFTVSENTLHIEGGGQLKPFSVKTHEYPGFPTDLQPPFTVLMTQAQGQSLIHETIYDRRLQYVDLLSQMGADITVCDPHRAIVNGPTRLFGKKLTTPDLRAGIAMLIAGTLAEGETQIENIYQIDRGYEDIDKRLRSIGVNIRREEFCA